MRQYVIDNKDKKKAYDKTHRRKRRQFINDYKLSKGCSVCGYNKCAEALEFHHPNDDKSFYIGYALTSRVDRIKLEEIKEEMNKCIVLCANCHRELHNKEA